MLKSLGSVIFILLCYFNLAGQITVPLSTLPEVGDVLLYQSLPSDSVAIQVDNQVFQTGGNLQWDFSNLESGFETTEDYMAVSAGTIADSFPNADIVIDFIGLKGYANRNTTDISIIGVASDSIAGLGIPIVGTLDNPFTIRRAPFGFEDQFASNSSYSVSIDASLLDSIQDFQDLVGQIPGVTIDSLRITTSISRTENIDAWGTLNVASGNIPVLKMTQANTITTTLEVFALTFIGSTWIDLGPFLPEGSNDFLNVNTTNHLFFGTESKEVLLEFSVTPDSTLLTTRYARGITSSLLNFDPFNNLIEASVYPNPARDKVTISIDTELLKNDLLIKLHNTAGQLIKSKVIQSPISEIDLINLNTGIHTLSIYSDHKLLYRNKLIISSFK